MSKETDEVELLLSIKDEMSKGFKKIESTGKSSLNTLDKSSKKTTKSLSSIGGEVKKIIAGFALFQVAKKGFDFVKETNANRDSILNLSNATGMAVKDLSALQYVAKRNKTSFDSVESSINKMVMTVGQAEQGSKNAIDAFDSLGISLKDESGELKDANTLFEESIDKLSGVENEMQRLTKAQMIFGRGAKEMGSIIDGGVIALREVKEEAESLGVVFDREAAESAAKFNDEMLMLESRADGLAQTILTKLNPALSDLIEGWNSIINGKSSDEFISKQAEFGATWAKANADLKLTIGLQQQLNKIIQEGSGKFLGRSISASEAGVQLDAYDEIKDQELNEIERLKEVAKLNGYITNEVRNRKAIEKTNVKDTSTKKSSAIAEPSYTDFSGSSKGSRLLNEEELLEINKKLSDIDEEEWNKKRNDLLNNQNEIKSYNDMYGFSEIERLKKEKDEKLAILEEYGVDRFETEKYYDNLIASEKKKLANTEMSIQKAVSNSAMDTSIAVINASQNALAQNKEAGKALKVLALAEIAINTSRGIMNAWASGSYVENIIETAGILGIAGIQTGVVAQQSFADGGVILPERGKQSYSGDNIMVNANAGEEVLKATDPRHINNIGKGTQQAPMIVNLEISGQQFAQLFVDTNSRVSKTGRPVGVAY